MNDYYQSPYQPVPMGNQPVTAEGEPVYLGPYNAQQAPYLECASCGQPITVGQRITVLQEFLLGITASGRLTYVPVVDFQEQAFVHSDCSAEFAHDQITKEPCGADDDVQGSCMYCDNKLNGEED
jgi:hypothetical protein